MEKSQAGMTKLAGSGNKTIFLPESGLFWQSRIRQREPSTDSPSPHRPERAESADRRAPHPSGRLTCNNQMSDAGVPSIASFWSSGAQTLSETFQIVGHRHVGDVF